LDPLRLLVDLDGTATEFKVVDTLETLYEEGYFRNLKPNENVVNAIKQIIYLHPEIEVYVMSSVLTDSKYALREKNEWIDEHLPQIDKEHRIFPPCGENKLDYVPGGFRETDHLLDDYTKNLALWEPPAKGIKLLNGINHTHESWQGNMLRYDRSPEELASRIVGIMKGQLFIRDEKPQESPLEDIVSQLKAIREEIHDIQEMWGITTIEHQRDNTENKPDTLEERYTQAMMLCGWRRVESGPDVPMTIAFENRYGTERCSFDGWEMVGQELEEGKITPILYTDIDLFYELIYPAGRVTYYTKNLGGTGLGADAIPVEYEEFTSALSAYDKASGTDGASIGYMINGEMVELAAFNSIEMKHFTRRQNWKEFPSLTQNEVSEVRNILNYLKHTLERSNTYHAITEGFQDIAINYAMSEMIRSKDLWGNWSGRVANTHRPQDYIDINIAGVRRTGEITIEVLMVHANEIVDAKTVSFDIDESNFENSLREKMNAVITDYEEYFRASVDMLGTDMNYPMELYANNMEHTLEEHYHALEDRGYSAFVDRSVFFAGKIDKKEDKPQTESNGFTHPQKTAKPKL